MKPLAIRSLMVVVLGSFLLSFSEGVGVDSFTIHLNDKLLLEEYVVADRTVKKVSIGRNNNDDLLKFKYSHCGKTGTARSIAIMNDDDRLLKSWKFADNTSMRMDVKVHELFAVKRSGSENMRLLYTSREIPAGVVLASLTFSDESKASLR